MHLTSVYEKSLIKTYARIMGIAHANKVSLHIEPNVVRPCRAVHKKD